jgi:hypothetical protein
MTGPRLRRLAVIALFVVLVVLGHLTTLGYVFNPMRVLEGESADVPQPRPTTFARPATRWSTPHMIPLTSDAASTLRTYLGELEHDLQSADSDILETVQRERNTLQIILGRKKVTADDLDVLETLREYADEEADEIEQEAQEDGINLGDLLDDPTLGTLPGAARAPEDPRLVSGDFWPHPRPRTGMTTSRPFPPSAPSS